MIQNFSLRPYQIEALTKIDKALSEQPTVLLQAIMGAGKTVIACRLIRRYYHETDRRFLLLVHKKEIVKQFLESIKKYTDIPIRDVGICCAGLDDYNISRRVTLATIQTFSNRIEHYRGCDLLIIDEAHRVNMGESLYSITINDLKKKNPTMRILGLTATPWRLGHGYIFGQRCKQGNINLFQNLTHKITYKELKDAGHLCKLKGKIAHASSYEADMQDARVAGDYVIESVGEIMSREIHLQTAVEAIHKYCDDYKCICVFCCTIEHAEKLKNLLGDECITIHSQLTHIERESYMHAWSIGKARICTSVNILAEGFDLPRLDCLVFARPTLSPVLYLQALGRALRTDTNKNHAFVLDLTDNTARFGTDLDAIKIEVPKSKSNDEKSNQVLERYCPQCDNPHHPACRQCPHCGYTYPLAEWEEANKVPDLADVEFEEKDYKFWADVVDTHFEIHESKKSQKFLGKIVFTYNDVLYNKNISIFICLPDFYSGYALNQSLKIWKKISYLDMLPPTCDEFVNYEHALRPIKRIKIDTSEKFWKIVDYEFDDEEDEEDDIPF